MFLEMSDIFKMICPEFLYKNSPAGCEVNIMRYIKDEEAVSPVIGVILMVAITVILAAVIAVFVFGLAGDLEAGSQKDVQITSSTDSDGKVQFTVFSGANVDDISYFKWTNGTNANSVPGDDISIGYKNTTNFPKSGAEIIYTAVFNDGTSQVVGKTS